MRRTLIAAALLEAGILLAVTRWSGDRGGLEAFVGLTGLATAAGVLGSNARHRRALMASLRERAERLELERDQQGHLAAAAERARIAREMHDIVAHNLSVMIALADGASYAVRDTPERAEAAMTTASRTGREALAEMRRLLGVLREGDVERELAPQPGIAEIEHVIEQVRAAGIPVDYRSEGEPGALPQGLQLAAYRIVQEALTNTLKHAGPGTRASVTLTYADGELEIDVRDEGGAASQPAEDGGGLRGMRERAAVYNGVVDAGPAPGGGWLVTTRLAGASQPAVGAGA
jgi:signal transduction histidine kinase